MTQKIFEMALCHHCTPVLMGWKPSNLVSFSNKESGLLNAILAEYEKRLSSDGIRLEVLCSCRRHEMVLVYRPEMLETCLSQKNVRMILEEEGYPVAGTLSAMLECLEKRFSCHEEFPHEIGLFLGYPVEDVVGFQKYKGQNSKLCGYWKVYGDAERAGKLFAQFDAGRAYLAGRLQEGFGIIQAIHMFPTVSAS